MYFVPLFLKTSPCGDTSDGGIMNIFCLSSASLVSDIWDAFVERFILPSQTYENLNVSPATVNGFLIGLFAGCVIALFVTVYNKQVLGGFVRALIRADALSAESAKTLDELGYLDKILIHRAITRNSALSSVVVCLEEQKYYEQIREDSLRSEQSDAHKSGRLRRLSSQEKDFKTDTYTHHFYIPEDKKYTAEVRYEGKGNTLRSAFIWSAVLAVALLVLLFFMPSILSFLNAVAA